MYTYSIVLISLGVIGSQIFVGKKRRNELLTSERLFCLSVIDNDVASAFDEIGDIITQRNRYLSEDIDPDLGPRL
jgi:hypothetical protein